MIKIIKKTGALEDYNPEKIRNAVNKSAKRVLLREFNDSEIKEIIDYIEEHLSLLQKESIPVAEMHNLVEGALEWLNPKVAKSYRDYRDNKSAFADMMSECYQDINTIYFRGDKENSNADSSLVSTKRTLSFNVLNKELYKKFFLNAEEVEAIKDGYIYIHDMSARRDTMNCCLFDVQAVLTGGFEMGNMWYNEPKSLDTAFDVVGDIVLSAASQQYGGFTLPEIDKVLAKYAELSYQRYEDEYIDIAGAGNFEGISEDIQKRILSEAAIYAEEKTIREAKQGFQGWEYKFNTVASSRGDYPFITLSFGLGKSKFEKMLSIACLNVRAEGQGKKDHKRPVLFPKLVFLYDEKLHGEGGELRDVFEAGIECSKKAMYPDWLSLTGEGYISSMYKQYGTPISPMGCRAFLSPWWKMGGMYKANEDDQPIFVGRFNIGAVSLNLPMILDKARAEGEDFFTELDYYLEMIRHIHIRTYAYLGEMKASTNPLAYTQGGFLGGYLNPNDKIKPLLKSATASFGITALNELQELYNRKSLAEDGEFALETLKYINDRVKEFKEEDGNLYAIYGTPAENLCGLQVKQFRKKYGIIPGVSDREYVSNSFHCHVTEDLTSTEKQDKEYRFWELCNGGKIQYVRYPVSYNTNAIKALVKRAMDMGLYEGVNLSLAYCEDCGHEELAMDVCPVCGSHNLTKIDRMNGYLSYSRVHGDTRLNEAKMAEIVERKSM